MYLLLSLIVLCLGCGAVAEKTKLSTANNEFALSLYKTIADDNVGKNLIFSPISISTALAMVHAGTAGNTKKQMATVLHLDKHDDKDIKKEFHDFLKSLDQPGNNFTLDMANGLFGKKGFTFKQSYVDDVKKSFLGEAEMLDFGGDPSGSEKRINDYAAEHTNQKIKELFPKGSITGDTTLVLVNAIYFKAFWNQHFYRLNTKKEPFHISKSEQADVDMMEMNDKFFQYASDDSLHCQVVELQYHMEKASMYVILPHEVDGLTLLEQHLTTEKLHQIIDNLSRKLVKSLKFPKFVMKQDIALIEFLKKLGMKDVFNGTLADLSGISEGQRLFVSKVFHKAYIGVDEDGTEAAAATGVEIMLDSAVIGQGPDIKFIADHPFMYLIVEKKTGSILFLGRMTKPPMEGERIGQFDAQGGSSRNVVKPMILVSIIGFMYYIVL